MSYFIAIGGGFDTDPSTDYRIDFLHRAAAFDTNGVIDLRILPITTASRWDQITDEERHEKLRVAAQRAQDLADLCHTYLPPTWSARVAVVPLLTQGDAQDPQHLTLLGPEVDGVFCMGGSADQAMRVLGGTAYEAALADLCERGMPFAGSSSGALIQSRAMIAWFAEGKSVTDSFQAGALDIRPDGGLRFGNPHVVIDVHFYQWGFLGRLLHASAVTGRVGLGIDINAAAHIKGDLLTEITGQSGVVLVQPPPCHQYAGAMRQLSARGFVVHLLAKGARDESLLAPQPTPAMPQQPPALHLPEGAGPLILGSAAHQLFPNTRSLGAGGDIPADLAHWRAGGALQVAEPALAGEILCTDPVPTDANALEEAARRWFRHGGITVAAGLGLVPGLAFESNLLAQAGWGRLFNLLTATPARFAIGIEPDTLLVISQHQAQVVGTGNVIVADGRAASFARSESGMLLARDVRVDVLADGDCL